MAESPPTPSFSGLPSSHTVCHLAFDRSASNLATSFRSCNDTSNFQMHSRTTPMSRIASDTPNMIMGMFGGLGQSVGADGIIFRSCGNKCVAVRFISSLISMQRPNPEHWTYCTTLLSLRYTPISRDGKTFLTGFSRRVFSTSEGQYWYLLVLLNSFFFFLLKLSYLF